MELQAVDLDLDSRLALRPAEAAWALGVSESLIRHNLDQIPHFHFESSVLISVDGLRGWISERTKAEKATIASVADAILEKAF